MKRACPALVESRSPRSPPRVSVFLDQAYLRLDTIFSNSLLKVLSGRIEASLGVHLRTMISAGRRAVRLLFFKQNCPVRPTLSLRGVGVRGIPIPVPPS
jgi:hypothetical protein